MEKHNLLKNESNTNNSNYLIKDSNILFSIPLDYNSYSEDDISEKNITNNTNNNYENTIISNSTKNGIKNSLMRPKTFLNDNKIVIPNLINIDKDKQKGKLKGKAKNYASIRFKSNNINLTNTLKQSSNINYMKKISNNSKTVNNNLNFINNKKQKLNDNKNNNNNRYEQKLKVNNKNIVNNNKYEKIKNKKTKKDLINSTNIINSRDLKNKNKHIKYKSLKSLIDNYNPSNNKIIKEKETNKQQLTNNNFTHSDNNLFYNKYVAEENKMINYNYFLLNPKNILDNKKSENNTIKSMNKYPINKVQINHINSNKIINKKNIKNKDVYIYLRNSISKENKFKNDDYLSNSQELLYNNTLNPERTKSVIYSIYNPQNKITPKSNKENIKIFSRTFVDIKDIATIEYKSNENFKNKKQTNISRQSKKNAKSYQKKYLNNSITQKKEISDDKPKKKNLSIKLYLDKNIKNNINNNNYEEMTSNTNLNNLNDNLINEALNLNDNKIKYSYNSSTNNTINTIINDKIIINNNNMIIPMIKNIKNKNLSLNQKPKKNNLKNKKIKNIIYIKRKISNQKCQSKIKQFKEKEKEDYSYNNVISYYTDNKNVKYNNNNFIQLSKNVKKIELFKPSTTERKFEIKENNDAARTDNNNKRIANQKNSIECKKEEKQSYIYVKSSLKKWRSTIQDISYYSNNYNSITKDTSFSFIKKYYNFYVKKPIFKLYFINKRYKGIIPINKLCVFSKNIILKTGNEDSLNISSFLKNKMNSKEEGNNTIIELNSSKYYNTNKNMEILDEIEDNDNEDFNIEEYEKNNINSSINSNKFNNSINNLNLIIEENPNSKNNNSTEGKEISFNKAELNHNLLLKSSTPQKPKKIFKIEEGLEKLCRIFFRNLELKQKQDNKKGNMNNINYLNLNLKKEKSEPNINFKTKKFSYNFSSTIQNWNFIDKKNYKNDEEIEEDNNINKNKKKKKKKHNLIININKAFSEEKIRDLSQMERRSVNLKTNFMLNKNQYDADKIDNINNNSNDIIINQRDKFNKLINNLNKENYNNTFNELFLLIGNKNKENPINSIYNDFTILLNNQFTFIELIVDKIIKERKSINISLISKLCNDLYLRLISDFIYLNRKKTKGENLKSIIKSECKQKFDECDIITLLSMNIEKNKINKEENFLEKIKMKLLGIIDFISELINVKMISQKIGLEYLDTLNKRINNFDIDIKKYEKIKGIKEIKNIYWEGEINLMIKLYKIIVTRKKPKHIQNFKNFIEDNIIPAINDKNISIDIIRKMNRFINEIKNDDFFKDINIKKDNNNNKEKNKNYK